MKKQEEKLLKLRRKIDQMDKIRLREEGKLEAAWKALCVQLGKNYSQEEIQSKAEKALKRLRRKYKETEKTRLEIFTKIEKMLEDMDM